MPDSNPPRDQPPNSHLVEGDQTEEEKIKASIEKLYDAIRLVQRALADWDNPAGKKELAPALALALRRKKNLKKEQRIPLWAAVKEFLSETFSDDSSRESVLDDRLAKLNNAVDALNTRASEHAELDRIVQQLRRENDNSRNSISRLREAAAQASPNPNPVAQPSPQCSELSLRGCESSVRTSSSSKVSLILNAKPQAFHTYCRGTLVLAVCLSSLLSYLYEALMMEISTGSPSTLLRVRGMLTALHRAGRSTLILCYSTGVRPASNQQTPVYRQGMASQPALNSQYASRRPDNLAPPQPELPTSGAHGRPLYAPSAHGHPPAFEQQPQELRQSPLSATLPRAGAPRLGQSRSADTYSSTVQRRPIPPFAQQFEGNLYQRSVALVPLPVPHPPPSPRNRGPRSNPGAASSRHEASQAQYPQQPASTIWAAPAASPQAPESNEQAQTRASFGSAFGFSGEPRARGRMLREVDALPPSKVPITPRSNTFVLPHAHFLPRLVYHPKLPLPTNSVYPRRFPSTLLYSRHQSHLRLRPYTRWLALTPLCLCSHI
ncbi:hypothetical protein DFP72DRAFT_906096 [Ephemerocybe angulata]|uniref:Uncharacterized protein n=1 Tax=Ephemerocybe angulata TaxID=980116 RepID=A0A8H6HSQ5_9AGAR|nr:hypothetical protein DFP72DRAFT_906096 [Tulosesus angulatus]